MKRIYVHGLGQTPASWDKVISHLRDGGNNICPNLNGIIGDREVIYGNLYQAFCNICDETGEALDLCGLSLGGVLALHYAIEHPEKVHSLVLIAAQYKMPRGMLRFQNAIFRFMPKSVFEQMGFGKREFISLCRSMMGLDFGTSLAGVSCPVLVICGVKDSANKKASIKLAELLENAEFQEIKDAGHEINTEVPERLAELLKEFYNKI